MKKYLSLGLVVFGLLFFSNNALAATAGANSGSNFSNQSSGSQNYSWTNGSNAVSSNNQYATSDITNSGHETDYLKVKGFGFSIPVGSTINGITVNVEKKQSCIESHLSCTSDVTDNIVRLVKNDSIIGTNKANTAPWGTSDAITTYGGIADLWGTTWSVSDINNSNFGIDFSAQRTSGGDRRVYVDHITITVTYTPAPTTGNLNVTKTTIGGNGTFAFSGSGFTNFNITTVLNTGARLLNNLTAGTYTVNETAQSGWDITSNNCTGVSVTAGNTTNCTIVNTKRGSITVYKDVVNPNSDAVNDAHTFSINLNGANTQNVSENSSYTYTNLVPGTYTITENTDGNYDFVSFSQDADSETNGAQIVVTPGVNATLTITNKQKVGHLTVIKHVDNSHGLGTSVASDFTMNITGTPATSFTGSESGTTVDLNPGFYSVSESSTISGYAMGQTTDCIGTLASNESKTCTITNYDLEPGKGAIVLVKSLVLNNGGTAAVGDFTLKVTPTESEPLVVTSGQVSQLTPGSYTVSETIPTNLTEGYLQTSLVCLNGETTVGSHITLEAGQVYRCTITNDDQPAHLTVVKHTTNNAYKGTLDATFNFNISSQEAPFSITTVEGTGETSFTLNKGTYRLTEDVLAGWNLTGASCVYDEESIGESIDNGKIITLDNGSNVTCTFTNARQTGTLIVKKTVSNDDGKTLQVSDFPGFTVNGGEAIPFVANEEDSMKGEKTIILEPGVYQISEPVTEGYFKVPENCDTVSIEYGETKTCSFRNEDVGFFVHSGGNSGDTGGQVLGASTENTATEAPKEEKKEEGKVLGATTCSTVYLNDYLFFGKNNKKGQVVLLQEFLNEHLALNPAIAVDGVYGKTTRDAVKAFQTKYVSEILTPWKQFGLKDDQPTGNVYKTTKWKINMLKCADLNLPMPQLP